MDISLMDILVSFQKKNGYSWKPEDDATSGHYRVKFNWNTDLG